MAKNIQKEEALYACVKDEVSSADQLKQFAQHVSFSRDKKSLVLSFSPPIAASILAKALKRCET